MTNLLIHAAINMTYRTTNGNSYPLRRQQHVHKLILSLLLLLVLVPESISRSSSSSRSSPYKGLANYLSTYSSSDTGVDGDLDFSTYPITGPSSIVSTLTDLSKAQSTLKAMDGASHELYQRSHSTSSVDEHSQSSGRAERSAHRVGCTADALMGCELLDFLDEDIKKQKEQGDKSETNNEHEIEEDDDDEEGTLTMNNRRIVFRTFLPGTKEDDLNIPMHVVILYEDNYNGGGGMHHGGIDGLTSSDTSNAQGKPRGRFLVLLRDECSGSLSETLHCLDTKPALLELDVGLVSGEMASVNSPLWITAETVLEACKDVLIPKKNNETVEKEQDSVDKTEMKLEDQDPHQDSNKPQKSELNKSENQKSQENIAANPDTLPVIHFVGRSLAGGVASLAATILDGSIPLPSDVKKSKRKSKHKKRGKRRNRHGDKIEGGQDRKGKRRRSRTTDGEEDTNHDDNDNTLDNNEDGSITPSSKRRRRRSKHAQRSQDEFVTKDDHGEEDGKLSAPPPTLHGLGRGRTSAVTLGAPPSISANIKASYITSVILGDDIICRSTYHSLTNLRKRAKRRLDGNLLTKKVGWMSDAVSLTVSSIQSHAHGSEGEEERLSIPGSVYLVRPRRLGASSMHEIGTGRDALRAAILWQLNDVLLSKSLWKHHLLESYIKGLDKVKLRGVADDDEDDGNDRSGYDESYKYDDEKDEAVQEDDIEETILEVNGEYELEEEAA